MGFFFFNLPLYHGVPWYVVTGAFFRGIVFDLNVILYINLPFILLSLLPFNFVFKPAYQLSLKILFFITNLIPVFFNVADFEYAKFIGKRSDSDLLGVKNDIAQQFGQMAMDFWYLALIGIVFGIILWKLYPLKTEKRYRMKITSVAGTFILFNSFVLLGLRGSLGMKPLLPISAYNKSPKTATLVLNTPFCVIHTLGKKPLEELKYFSDGELMKNLPLQYVKRDTAIRTGQNIVIFILESFSPEFIGHLTNGNGYTSFLDSIANEGVSFRYGFSNGRTSQQAVPSILAGIPQLMNESIITSQYQTDNFFSLPDFLKEYGYNAYFFHGGNNGTMGFDRFTEKIGYTYFGADEYPDKSDHDGDWGIYDGPYLRYCAKMMTDLPKPFIASVFTLSSHQPYLIPKELRDTFSKGKYPAQNAIAYADYALRGFFESASRQDWYTNTLFVFSADHTHPPVEESYEGFIDTYHIPIIFFHPGMALNCDTSRIVQQVDILPSVADFLGVYPPHMPRFGTSVFMDNPDPEAILFNSDRYFLVRKGYYCELESENPGFYDWHDRPLKTDSLNNRDITRLNAYRQYYNDGMIENSFTK